MNKIGYIVGFALGIIFIGGLYLFSILAFINDIINGQLPVAPVALFLIIIIWRKVMVVSTYISLTVASGMIRKESIEKQAEVVRMMNSINNKMFGGSN